MDQKKNKFNIGDTVYFMSGRNPTKSTVNSMFACNGDVKIQPIGAAEQWQNDVYSSADELVSALFIACGSLDTPNKEQTAQECDATKLHSTPKSCNKNPGTRSK